jgi:hypothetical protein
MFLGKSLNPLGGLGLNLGFFDLAKLKFDWC